MCDRAARVTRLCDGLSGNEIGPVHGAVLLFVNSRPSQGYRHPASQVRAADENDIAGMQVSSRSRLDDLPSSRRHGTAGATIEAPHVDSGGPL